MNKLQGALKDIKDLVVCSYRGINPNTTEFSATDIHGAAVDAIHSIASDYNSYRRHKCDLFEIIQEATDEIIPKYVEDTMGAFAEIKSVPHGTKASFVRKTGRQRAKQFITMVGLSGVYEAFRLDKDVFDMGGHAIGGAAYIDFERYICGDEDIAESMGIIIEGLQEAIMGEVQKALIKAVDAENRPAKNVYVGAGFDADEMQSLVNVAKSYGDGKAIIYATPEFIAEMGPDAIGMPITYGTAGFAAATPVYSPKDINDIATTGLITTFRGTPIVEIPQSYIDAENEVTQMNPSLAYIFPAGKEKVVKIVLEGDTIVKDFENRDNSMEIQSYKKIGVAILTNHNWCIYENATLADTDNFPTKYPVA